MRNNLNDSPEFRKSEIVSDTEASFLYKTNEAETKHCIFYRVSSGEIQRSFTKEKTKNNNLNIFSK